MKRLNVTLLIVLITGLFILSCEDGSDAAAEVLQEVEEEEPEEPEQEPEEENFIPIIELSPGSQTIENGASLTFSVDIDDQDDFYHFYCWTVDGVDCGSDETMSFSASPEYETSYIISVAVSDGSDLVTASSLITVKQRPWQPEPLNIYFFEIGSHESDETAVKRYTTADVDEYDYFCIASITSLEMYNRDNDPDAYRVLGGYP